MTTKEVLWEVPVLQLLLLEREDARYKGDDGITLEDMEAIDRWQNTN